jgi:hypothetical protein
MNPNARVIPRNLEHGSLYPNYANGVWWCAGHWLSFSIEVLIQQLMKGVSFIQFAMTALTKPEQV